MAQVSVRGGASASLVGNRLADGRASGVHVSEGGRATLEANVIEGHRLCGVELEGGRCARLRARRNELRRNGGGAWSMPAGGDEDVLLEGNVVE